MTTTETVPPTTAYAASQAGDLPPIVGPDLQHEIQQFLYFEAQLLDEHRYEEWLELFAADLHYWMPARTNRLRRQQNLEVSTPTDVAHFDETATSLRQRVRRLESGMAWAEDPRSRTRRLLTNVRVRPGEFEGEYAVTSNFIVYKNRLDRDHDLMVGEREDLLRRVAPLRWRIAKRKILLDQTVVLSQSLVNFL